MARRKLFFEFQDDDPRRLSDWPIGSPHLALHPLAAGSRLSPALSAPGDLASARRPATSTSTAAIQSASFFDDLDGPAFGFGRPNTTRATRPAAARPPQPRPRQRPSDEQLPLSPGKGDGADEDPVRRGDRRPRKLTEAEVGGAQAGGAGSATATSTTATSKGGDMRATAAAGGSSRTRRRASAAGTKQIAGTSPLSTSPPPKALRPPPRGLAGAGPALFVGTARPDEAHRPNPLMLASTTTSSSTTTTSSGSGTGTGTGTGTGASKLKKWGGGFKGGLGGLKAGLKAEMANLKAAKGKEAYATLRGRTAKSFANKDWASAEEALSQQIDDYGGHTNALLYSSRSYARLKLGRPAEALKDAELASEHDCKSAAALLRRGSALARLDRPGEAGSALLECMERRRPPGD